MIAHEDFLILLSIDDFKTWIPCIHSLTSASSPSQPPFIKFNTLTKFVNQFDDVIFFKLKVLMLAVVQQKVLLKIKISSFYFICKWSQHGLAPNPSAHSPRYPMNRILIFILDLFNFFSENKPIRGSQASTPIEP